MCVFGTRSAVAHSDKMWIQASSEPWCPREGGQDPVTRLPTGASFLSAQECGALVPSSLSVLLTSLVDNTHTESNVRADGGHC